MSKINIFQKDIQYFSQNWKKPIALVGMMGAGKSHIGLGLANILQCDFFDSDKIIEEKARLSIPEIFEQFGEEKFRSSEHSTISDLLEEGKCVVATGGGALQNAQTLEQIKEKAYSVWLNADLETIWKRIKDSDRPLLQTENSKEFLASLMETRKSQYSQADLHIPIKDEAPEHIVQIIIKSLSEM